MCIRRLGKKNFFLILSPGYMKEMLSAGRTMENYVNPPEYDSEVLTIVLKFWFKF